jgi:hypothetical protein
LAIRQTLIERDFTVERGADSLRHLTKQTPDWLVTKDGRRCIVECLSVQFSAEFKSRIHNGYEPTIDDFSDIRSKILQKLSKYKNLIEQTKFPFAVAIYPNVYKMLDESDLADHLPEVFDLSIHPESILLSSVLYFVEFFGQVQGMHWKMKPINNPSAKFPFLHFQ